MDDDGNNTGLLLVAHGERGGSADNAGVVALAERLAARHLAGQIGCGFIRSTPSIESALGAFSLSKLIVYPLFLADGYFTRNVLIGELEAAALRRAGPAFHVLPALGLDMGLANMIARKAAAIAAKQEFELREATLVLLAHGSSQNSASRRATERLARHAQGRALFRSVRAAFLEESPAISDVLRAVRGPAIIVGLFMGCGLHGGDDVDAIMRALGRGDAIFAGNVVSFPELADVVAGTVKRHWQFQRLAGPRAAAHLSQPDRAWDCPMGHS